jgi:hypothetical protein
MYFQFTNPQKFGKMKRFTYAIGLMLLIISCEKPISEFQTHNFIKYIGNGSGSAGYDALQLSDGGYIVTGYDISPQLRKQVLVSRIDKAGNIVWQKFFGTEHNEEGRIVKLLNDEILISGNKTNNTTSINEAFLLRLNLQGDSIACYTYSATSNLVINDLAISSNHIYIAGEQYESTSTLSQYFIACINIDGQVVWKWALGDANKKQTFKKIFLKDNGNILLVGTTNAIIESNLTHISVAEFNSVGVNLGYIYLESDVDQEFGNAIYNNNLYILYSTQQGSSKFSKITAVKANNDIGWVLNINIPGKGTSMVMQNSNSFLLTTDNNDRTFFYSLLVSTSGTAEISELRDFPGEVNAMINTADDGVLSIGSSSPDYGSMVRLIKTDSDLYLLQP